MFGIEHDGRLVLWGENLGVVAPYFSHKMAEKTLALSTHLCLILAYLSQQVGFHFDVFFANMFQGHLGPQDF